jgi:hypothetical protein
MLKGSSTFTSGADASVDPVTATLPVAPASVHSGAPPLVGAAVGHVLASVAVSAMEGGVDTTEVEDELAAGGFVSEPHAASVMTSDAAQAMSATEERTRGQFIVVTLQRYHAALGDGPSMSVMARSATTSQPSKNFNVIGTQRNRESLTGKAAY